MWLVQEGLKEVVYSHVSENVTVTDTTGGVITRLSVNVVDTVLVVVTGPSVVVSIWVLVTIPAKHNISL